MKLKIQEGSTFVLSIILTTSFTPALSHANNKGVMPPCVQKVEFLDRRAESRTLEAMIKDFSLHHRFTLFSLDEGFKVDFGRRLRRVEDYFNSRSPLYTISTTRLNPDGVDALKKVVANLPLKYRETEEIKGFVRAIDANPEIGDPSSAAIFVWLTQISQLDHFKRVDNLKKIIVSEGLNLSPYSATLNEDFDKISEIALVVSQLKSLGARGIKTMGFSEPKAVQSYLEKGTMGADNLQSLLTHAPLVKVKRRVPVHHESVETSLFYGLLLDREFASTLKEVLNKPALNRLSSESLSPAEVATRNVLYLARSVSELPNGDEQKKMLLPHALQGVRLIKAWNPDLKVPTRNTQGVLGNYITAKDLITKLEEAQK